jgi:uncharacterized membrane protein
VTIDGLQFYPPDGGKYCKPPYPTVSIGTTSTIDATCLLGSLQESALTMASSLNSQQLAGLGLSGSIDISDLQTDIATLTANKCGGTSSKSTVSITDTIIEACNFQVVSNATANQSCQINEVQKLMNDMAQNIDNKTEGGSVFGALFGNGIVGALVGIVIIIVVLLVLGFILYHFLKGGSHEETGMEEVPTEPNYQSIASIYGQQPPPTSEQPPSTSYISPYTSSYGQQPPSTYVQPTSTYEQPPAASYTSSYEQQTPPNQNGGCQSNKNKKLFFVIFIIIIATIVVLIIMYKNKKKQIKLEKSDVGRYQQLLSEAKQIMQDREKTMNDVQMINYNNEQLMPDANQMINPEMYYSMDNNNNNSLDQYFASPLTF